MSHSQVYERMLISNGTWTGARVAGGPDPAGLALLVTVACVHLGEPIAGTRYRIATPPRVFLHDGTAIVAAELDLPSLNKLDGRPHRGVLAYAPRFDQRYREDDAGGFSAALATEDTRLYAAYASSFFVGATFSDHDERAHPLPRRGEDVIEAFFGNAYAYRFDRFKMAADAVVALARFID